MVLIRKFRDVLCPLVLFMAEKGKRHLDSISVTDVIQVPSTAEKRAPSARRTKRLNPSVADWKLDDPNHIDLSDLIQPTVEAVDGTRAGECD